MRLLLPLMLLLTATSGMCSVKPETERQIDSLIQGNKTGEAIFLIETTLQANPDWQPGLWRLGNLFYGADRFSPAHDIFLKLTALDVKQGAPWALLGLTDFALHDYAAATDHIQHGLAVGFPAGLDLAPICYLQLASSLLVSEKYDRALTVLTGLSNQKDSAQTQQLLAGLATLRLPMLPDLATRLFNPQQLAIVNKAGAIALGVARNDLPDADAQWRGLVDANSNFQGVHAGYGKYLLETANASAAEIQFRAALHNDPSDVNATLGLGFALAEEGKLDEAVAVCTQALHLEPNSANGHYLLGSLYVKAGEYQKARIELEQSRDIDPNLSRVHYALAQVYLKQHATAEAAHEAAAYKLLKGNEESFRTAGRLAAPATTEAQP